MNPFQTEHLSHYVKEELIRMQNELAPYVKKSMAFSLIAVPLIVFSSINLYVLLFGNVGETSLEILIFLAFLAALGTALLVESIHLNKEMVQKGIDYMINRIKTSEMLSDAARERYVDAIKNDERRAYQIFYDFLQHEERLNELEK